MTVRLDDHNTITANRATLNQISLVYYEASIRAQQRGCYSIARDYDEKQMKIYDALYASGYYKTAEEKIERAGA